MLEAIALSTVPLSLMHVYFLLNKINYKPNVAASTITALVFNKQPGASFRVAKKVPIVKGRIIFITYFRLSIQNNFRKGCQLNYRSVI